ncbi:hypothetical protein M2298_001299 [Brevibacillus sp. 1238]|jgi:hypothetical protein|uniref:Uncharacterized protein n=1 Tax=Brevibacillus parabrevis TaxID=54914 RepID=A0A4Y3PJT2_BREPA|nr:hypothetical protein [Brevibacillus sp. 1238]GEB32236.1 hypothetical protein BPA01_18160 [Brevibacillus parabrevis]
MGDTYKFEMIANLFAFVFGRIIHLCGELIINNDQGGGGWLCSKPWTIL